jgi:hypothetical protein
MTVIGELDVEVRVSVVVPKVVLLECRQVDILAATAHLFHPIASDLERLHRVVLVELVCLVDTDDSTDNVVTPASFSSGRLASPRSARRASRYRGCGSHASGPDVFSMPKVTSSSSSSR